MNELEQKLIERAERSEERVDGKYLIIPARSLSSDEAAEMIMREVHRLQNERNQ